ncbi:MAG: sugar phosphate isomerase/epimerase family protein [Gimesia sp.]
MANRRSFFKVAGIGVAAAAIPGLASASVSDTLGKKDEIKFDLGVASYSLRNFSQEEAIDMTLRCGVNRICFKSMHLPLDSDSATIKKATALCKEKGINLYGGGVIYMKSKEQVDQAFEYAKTAAMDMIVGVPNHELLEYVEGKVKEYGIKLAIHNHGPGDKLYPSAESAYNLIKNLDKRMGLCIDIGHTKRINRDPEQDVLEFFDRVFDVHIKDVTKAATDGKTCIIGRGVINFPSFLTAIVKKGYSGSLALEYEAEGDDPLPGMMESFGYIKGILATM